MNTISTDFYVRGVNIMLQLLNIKFYYSGNFIYDKVLIIEILSAMTLAIHRRKVLG